MVIFSASDSADSHRRPLPLNRNREVDFCVIVTSHSRCSFREFPMYRPSITGGFRVEVKHRYSPGKRYSWEIYSEDKILAVKNRPINSIHGKRPVRTVETC